MEELVCLEWSGASSSCESESKLESELESQNANLLQHIGVAECASKRKQPTRLPFCIDIPCNQNMHSKHINDS